MSKRGKRWIGRVVGIALDPVVGGPATPEFGVFATLGFTEAGIWYE